MRKTRNRYRRGARAAGRRSAERSRTPASAADRPRSALPRHPLVVDSGRLKDCLELMGTRPLKLVAERTVPALRETRWSAPRWAFAARRGRLARRALLAYAADTFQFSVANERSRQDAHRHRRVLEILVSARPIRITYGRGLQNALRVPAGALIVPPGVWHKVKLSGLAWVFQTVCGRGAVHDDKDVMPAK